MRIKRSMPGVSIPFINFPDDHGREGEGPFFSFGIFEDGIRRKPERTQIHRHDFFEIFFFKSGSAEFFTDFNRFSLSAGSAVFVSPGQVHGWPTLKKLSGYIICFSACFVKRILGRNMIWILIALQFVVPAMAETPFTSPAMVAKVTKAIPTDEVVVVVHQRPEFIEPTISLLDQPLYANMPRVVLTDGTSSPVTPSLRDRATLVQYSKLGELSLNVDASTVTLIGGSANDCLRTSGQFLIKEILERRGRRTLTIRIPSSVVWGWKQKPGGFTLYDSFCKGSPATFDSRVREYVETIMKDMNFPCPFSLAQLYQIEPGRAGEKDYGFVFTRKSDGKKVKLIIEHLCDVGATGLRRKD